MAKVTRELPPEDRDESRSSLDTRAPGGGLPIQGGLSEGTMRDAGFGGGVLPGMDDDISLTTIDERGVQTADGGLPNHPIHDGDEEDLTPDMFEAQMDDIEAAAGDDFAALLEDEVEDPDSLQANDVVFADQPEGSTPPFDRDHDAEQSDRTTWGRDQDERP